MYFLSKFCSACLKDNTNLSLVQKASEVDWKLSECLRGVDWGFIQQFYICAPCRTNLDIAFEFRKTCLKSVATLETYLTILQEEGGTIRKNLDVRLGYDEIPKQLLDDYKLENTVNPNVVVPSPIGAIVPGTNIILNPFSFYNIIPTNALFPINFQLDSQTSLDPQPTINFQPIPAESAKKSERNTIPKSPLTLETTPNVFHSMPQLVIINPVPPIEPPDKNISTMEIEDILNGAESEEMSVSVDPMAFDIFDDESNPYSMDDDSNLHPSHNDVIEMEPTEFICIKCNATFNEARELSVHKKFSRGCRTKHFEKGTKLAMCLKCNRQFCTQQYLKKHLLRCKSSKPKRKQKRKAFVKQERNENENVEENGNHIVKTEIVQPINLAISETEISPSDFDVTEPIITLKDQLRKDAMHFRCQFCNEKFTNGALLEDHLPGHYNYFKCSGCNETFTDVGEIPVHMVDRHEAAKPVTCVTCNMEFRTNESIEWHSELHLKNLVFECHVCNTRYKNVAELNVHVPQHFCEFKDHADFYGRRPDD